MAPRLRGAARPLLASALLVPASLGLTQAVTATAATAAPAQTASAAVTDATQATMMSSTATESADRAAMLKAASARAAQASAAKAMTRLRLNAFDYARRQLHKPYEWGGTGPSGFDCSGLVYASFRSRALRLPRTTEAMLGSWHLVRIPKSKARRGDLAFFGTGHVEFYAHGNYTYGAASSGTLIGWHRMNAWWHPTMYFEVRR
jgi:cell wall-associated NlpC family hydrolase